MTKSRSDEGCVTAEWACGMVAAISAVLVLMVIVLSDWFEEQLYRPFQFALRWF